MLRFNGTDPVTLLRASAAAKGKTRGDLAKRLGVSQQTAGKWLNGKTSMPFDKVVEAADSMGFDVRIEFVERSGLTDI